MNVVHFKSSAEFRAWLEKHHVRERELWVGFYKKASGRIGITYAEALDEALCFGWIDGIKKRVDEFSYTHRFTPRKAKSCWSLINIKRAGELIELARMRPAGLKAFEARDEAQARRHSSERENCRLDAKYETAFRANAEAWDFFQKQRPSYQKLAHRWIMEAKKEETRLRRLGLLIAESERSRLFGQWIGKAKT